MPQNTVTSLSSLSQMAQQQALMSRGMQHTAYASLQQTQMARLGSSLGSGPLGALAGGLGGAGASLLGGVTSESINSNFNHVINIGVSGENQMEWGKVEWG